MRVVKILKEIVNFVQVKTYLLFTTKQKERGLRFKVTRRRV